IREIRDEFRLAVLKLYLLIFIALIFDSKVDGGIPSRAAAPKGPDTRPSASARAASIILRSSAADLLRDGRVAGRLWNGPCESQVFLPAPLPLSCTPLDHPLTSS